MKTPPISPQKKTNYTKKHIERAWTIGLSLFRAKIKRELFCEVNLNKLTL